MQAAPFKFSDDGHYMDDAVEASAPHVSFDICTGIELIKSTFGLQEKWKFELF